MIPTLSRRLVRVLPSGMATLLAIAQATRSQRLIARQRDRQLLAHARRLQWGDHGELRAWQWGRGPLVVLIHGWGGCAAQMAALAQAVARAGYRAVAVDMSGHGDSRGLRVTWAGLIRDAALAARSFGEAFAVIGHSASGLALMAARKKGMLEARRFVCIAAPSHPFPAVQVLHASLNPPPAVVDRYRAYLGAQFGASWDTLATGSSFAGCGEELLLVYDTTDKFVPHSEGDRLKSLCPAATLVKVSDHGHSRMLGAPEVAAAVTAFLTCEPVASSSIEPELVRPTSA